MRRIELKKPGFSVETIKRLSLYLRDLRRLKQNNIDIISSRKITELLNVTPVQFRKDLSYFGGFGKRGVGYQVKRLIQEIEKILGVNKTWDIILVGAGKLGTALLGFDGFAQFNLKIRYAFDVDKDKIGKVRKGVKLESITHMPMIIKREHIKIAVIATPPESAQAIAENLVKAGIKGILNFAPVVLNVPEHVSVSNVDMACELENLVFFAKRRM